MVVSVSRWLVHVAVVVLLATASASTVGLATTGTTLMPTDGADPADAVNASSGPDDTAGNPHGADRPSSHDPAEAVTHSHGAGDPPGPAAAAAVGNDTDDERGGSEDEEESDGEGDDSADVDTDDGDESDGDDSADDDTDDGDDSDGDEDAGSERDDEDDAALDEPDDPRQVEGSDGRDRWTVDGGTTTAAMSAGPDHRRTSQAPLSADGASALGFHGTAPDPTMRSAGLRRPGSLTALAAPGLGAAIDELLELLELLGAAGLITIVGTLGMGLRVWAEG